MINSRSLLCLILNVACVTAAAEKKSVPDSVVGGGLTTREVQGGIKAKIELIRVCYEQLLKTNPKAQGKVKVKFVVGFLGTVEKAEMLQTSLDDLVAERCIVDTVKTMTFPKPRNAPQVIVTYPFSFAPL